MCQCFGVQKLGGETWAGVVSPGEIALSFSANWLFGRVLQEVEQEQCKGDFNSKDWPTAPQYTQDQPDQGTQLP